MVDFLLLILADILLACNFAATKGYQKREGVSAEKALKFNLLLGLFSALLMAFLEGFHIQVTLYSAAMALGMAVLLVAYNLLGFRIMARGTMALYTIFLMTGGMIIPYIWGLLFLGEPFTLLRTAGLAVITAAVVLSHSAGKKCGASQLLLCFAVFVLNGFTSVISKEHQISPLAVSTNSFVCLSSLAKVLISLAGLLILRRRKTIPGGMSSAAPAAASGVKPKSVLLILLAAVFTSASSLLQLSGAKSLPATVLYPVVTGGSILFIALAGRLLFRETLTKRALIGMLLCFAGTCMFL